MSEYHPIPHRADGGFRVAGVPLLFGAILLAGVSLGWLASFIGQWFYFIALFPTAIASGLVLVCHIVGRWTHLRNPALAGLAGLFAGIVSMTSMHYFDYLRFVDDPQVKALMAAIPPENRTDSFPGFMHFSAERGVSLGKDGFNLGYVGTWVYWGLETLLVTGGCFWVVASGAAEPYCRNCEAWKQYRELGTLRGKEKEVTRHLQNGAIDRLQAQPSAPESGDHSLSAAVCPVGGDECTITVKLEEIMIEKNNEVQKRQLVELTYPGEALAEFEALFVEETVSPPARPQTKQAKHREDDDY